MRLVNRTGIATGEVAVTASSAGEHILVGDVVRLANRLEQSAPAMEVLVGESTYRMVANRVTVAQADPVLPHGATVAVPAYRLVSVHPGWGSRAAAPVRATEDADADLPELWNEKIPSPFRRCGSCGAHLIAKRAREIRKTVTIIFADLKATSALGEPLGPGGAQGR